MPDAWYTFLSTLCARAYFARIRVFGAERLPRRGPILYVGLHRNGAVDGFVYKSIFRRAIFLISAQLQKSLFSRIFFAGIPVVRDKDSGDRGMNAVAMGQSGKLLERGGELFVFPEGTSSLGPQHLPFKSGAARIAVEAWNRGIPLKVVPLGITYDAPWTFRSSVEVIVGEAIGAEAIARPPGEEQLEEAKTAITGALENVGINVPSTEYFEQLRAIAKIALPPRSHFQVMKLCERGIPEKLEAPWKGLRDGTRKHQVSESEETSTFSTVSPWISLLAGSLFAPIVVVAAMLNFLPLGGAYWAGKKLPDAPNVITLWRILVGTSLFFVWYLLVLLGLALAGKAVWFVGFLLVTHLGWLAYQPARQLLIAGWNGVRFRELRQQYLEFQELLLQELGRY